MSIIRTQCQLRLSYELGFFLQAIKMKKTNHFVTGLIEEGAQSTAEDVMDEAQHVLLR